jgi:Sugar-binding cellulase-like
MLNEWMDQELRKRARIAAEHDMVCGNTEGWGPINWYEHPAMDWEFTKEAGLDGVELALKHGFKFICTSNFTHPQFPGIWNDVSWHKHLTEMIKKGF